MGGNWVYGGDCFLLDPKAEENIRSVEVNWDSGVVLVGFFPS